MKTIKMFNVELVVDGEKYHYEDNQWMEDIHIPEDMRAEMLRHLMCVHEADLTEAYRGHTVIVRLVAPREEMEEDEE